MRLNAARLFLLNGSASSNSAVEDFSCGVFGGRPRLAPRAFWGRRLSLLIGVELSIACTYSLTLLYRSCPSMPLILLVKVGVRFFPLPSSVASLFRISFKPLLRRQILKEGIGELVDEGASDRVLGLRLDLRAVAVSLAPRALEGSGLGIGCNIISNTQTTCTEEESALMIISVERATHLFFRRLATALVA